MAGIEFAQGRFHCKVVGQFLSAAKSGNEQFALQFEPIGQINPADPEGELLNCPVGKSRTMYRAITPKTIDWLKKDLKYLCERGGITPRFTSFADLCPNTPGFTDFTNIEFEAWCDHETYEGKTREKWNIASGSAEAKPLEPAAMRKLDALFGKELKSLSGEPAKPAGRTVAQKKQPATVPPRDESENTTPDLDIPF